jgi:cell surface protein SprA
MQVCELADGDARAIFKSLNLDLRRYKRILMDIHGEALIGATESQRPRDGDLTVFMRIGSDFTQNYYELEIPLLITRPDEIPAGTIDDIQVKEAIWRSRMDFPMDSFVTIKLNRNAAGVSPFVPFEELNRYGPGENDYFRLSIIGNPDLGMWNRL